MCTTLRKITDIKTIEVSLSSILLKMISKFTCVMMRRWRSEPPHYQRISKDSGARFLAGLSLLWPMILHQSKKVAAKLWKRADMLKKWKYRKRCYLISDFWNNLLAEIKNAASWCIDASMYLCLHLLHIINNNDTKKVQSKKYIYQKGELCLYRTNSLNLLTQKSMVFYE